jgi:anthranilate phosphoribosyltransferase
MTTTIHAITPQEALQRVIEHREIFHDEMLHIMRLIMSGEMSPVLMSASLPPCASRKKPLARSPLQPK